MCVFCGILTMDETLTNLNLDNVCSLNVIDIAIIIFNCL